jgi:hypothetical protein
MSTAGVRRLCALAVCALLIECVTAPQILARTGPPQTPALAKLSGAERRAIVRSEAELRARQQAAAAELPAADRQQITWLKEELRIRLRFVLLSPCEVAELVQPALAVLAAHDARGDPSPTARELADTSHPTAAERRALGTMAWCGTGPAIEEMERNVIDLANGRLTWGEYRGRNALLSRRLYAALKKIGGTLAAARRAAVRQAGQWDTLVHLISDETTPIDEAERLIMPCPALLNGREGARPADSEQSQSASAPLPAVQRVILLVTWLVNDQPPSSYQTEFNSMAACQRARDKVLAENARLEKQEEGRTAAMEAWTREHGGFYIPGVPPSVSAICVAR